MNLRCPKCRAKLAELLDGKVAITCRKCHTVVLLQAEAKLTSGISSPTLSAIK